MKRLLLILMWFVTGCGVNTPFIAPPNPTCTVTQDTGGATITCPDGTKANVLNGISGANGTNGTNGTNGINGTMVTEVQFCPGTTYYPTQLNEVGFCINGNIYAVWSYGSFLTLITPGSYASVGLNSTCNFTVSANCVVTN
jgi:hypothetical protein